MMRYLFLLCIVFSLCLSTTAGETSQNNFEIILQLAPSLSSIPQKVYLRSLMENEEDIQDSAVVDSRHHIIKLHGRVPYQTKVTLIFSKTNLDAEIIVSPNENIRISLCEEDAEYYQCIKDAKGSKAHSEYVRFMNYIKTTNIRKAHYQDILSISKLDPISRKSVSDSMDSLQKQYLAQMIRTTKSNNPYLVWYANVLLKKQLSKEQFIKILNESEKRFPSYSPIKMLRPGYSTSEESARSKAIHEKLWRIKDNRMKVKQGKNENARVPQIGEELPIMLHREDNLVTSLLAFRGKLVLVDFWASWCQPCLKEIPTIVKAKRIFGVEFEVCAITLDKISSPWKRAISERDFNKGINHYQGIDKQGNQYKDIANLGFNTIPQNYLLDREGKIIAINIYGEELIKKLEELTKKK